MHLTPQKDAFKRSIELAKQWGLYRGCIYTLRERRKHGN